MLSKLFRPKWQHADPSVRAAAVRKLREDNPAHVEILTQLATQDPAADVRLLAAGKITDIDQLINLLNEEQAHLSAIEQQLIHQLGQTNNPASAFDRLINGQNNERAFQIVCSSGHGALLQDHLHQANHQQLLGIVLSNAPIQLRKEAAEKITSPTDIETLLKETRQSDKTIHKIMRDKLNALKEQERLTKQQTELAHDICSQMQQLSKGEWFPLYPAKQESLLSAWEQLDERLPIDSLKETFAQALQQSQQRIDEHQATLEAQKREVERQEQAQQKAIELLEQQTLLVAQINDNHASVSESDWAHIKQAWSHISPTHEEQKTTFSRQSLLLDEYFSHLSMRDQKISEAQEYVSALLPSELSALDNRALKALRSALTKALSTLNWPEQDAQPEPVTQLAETLNTVENLLRQEQQQKSATQQLIQQQLDELSRYIKAGEAKQADKFVKKLNDSFRSNQQKLSTAQEQHLRQLQAQLQELKDWQGYAVTPKKEQLCEEMEQLAAQDSMPAPEKSQRIKELQQQWKLLDSTDPIHSSLLWKRFKAASDTAYEPCEAYFSQQRELRAYNLSQREMIVAEVSQYLNTVNWDETYWRDIETVITAAKREWRRFIPVDRNPGQKIQQAFNELIVSTEARFKVIKEAALQQKEAIINDAHQLAQSDDPKAAAEQAKLLQEQWKEAGPTFHSQERKLWKRFRVECDAIFNRLTEHQQEQRSIINPRTELLAHTHTLQHFSVKPLALKTAVAAHHAGSEIIDNFPAISARDSQQFRKAAHQLEEQLQQLKRLEAQESTHAFIALTKELDQLEEQILSSKPTTAITVNINDCKGSLPDSLINAIKARQSAVEAVISSSASDIDDLLWAQSDRSLRELCIRLEIALGESTPESDHALRMEYQMQRLQQVLDQPLQATTLLDIRLLELEWSTVAFNQTFDTLCERFEALTHAVFEGMPA